MVGVCHVHERDANPGEAKVDSGYFGYVRILLVINSCKLRFPFGYFPSFLSERIVSKLEVQSFEAMKMLQPFKKGPKGKEWVRQGLKTYRIAIYFDLDHRSMIYIQYGSIIDR